MNNSGWEPQDDKVLFLPDPIVERTQGGIIIPETEQDRLHCTQTRGTIVAVGPLAFADYGDVKPQIGDIAVIGKYAGQILEGRMSDDGKEYRFINDREIVAVRKK